MPLEKAKHHQPSEFQAVVLAGYGDSNRLYPISGEDLLQKPLLPVGNKAMILYTLEWLERAGINDVIIVMQSTGSAPADLRRFLGPNYSGNIHYTVKSVMEESAKEENANEYIGTASALRKIKAEINRDFIVITCDLITDLDPRDLLDMHRLQDPTVTALFYEAQSIKKEEMLYVGVDPAHNALAYVANVESDDSFSMRMSLLQKFPRVQIHKDLQDAHLYIFKKSVLDLLEEEPHISSISKHLIPMLVKCQYQRKLAERASVHKYKENNDNSLLQRAMSLSTTLSDDIDESLLLPKTIEADVESPVKTQVYIYRKGFCCRGNTIAGYSSMNRHVTKQGANVTRIPSTAEVAPKTQVGNDSMIGDSTKIDERSSIKNSCVGAHCVIGKGVKIANSVIMDHVVVKDYAKIDGCVISNDVKIEEKASLKDSEVGEKYSVEKEEQVKGEKLVNFVGSD